jgi:hypothetical protein
MSDSDDDGHPVHHVSEEDGTDAARASFVVGSDRARTATDVRRQLLGLRSGQSNVPSGMLLKKGGGQRRLFGRRNWKSRWFELHGFLLIYFKSHSGASPQGVIDIAEATVITFRGSQQAKYPYYFVIQTVGTSTSGGREFELRASSGVCNQSINCARSCTL